VSAPTAVTDATGTATVTATADGAGEADAVGSEVVVGVRPEKVSLVQSGAEIDHRLRVGWSQLNRLLIGRAIAGLHCRLGACGA